MTVTDDYVVIGTSKGQLVRNRVIDDHGQLKVSTPDIKRNFAQKSITQLTAVGQLGVLISLSDGYVSLYHLDTFDLIARIEKSKGCR